MSERPMIIHVVGNRPQFVKLAVLHKEIAKHHLFDQTIIHTGQHSSRAMSDIFFDDLNIPAPDIQLDISASGTDTFIGNATEQISRILSAKPALARVMVYGDTNSTLAAALAAARSGNVLLHFESGVRTDDKRMPEEINRVLTDRLSDVHFCCTQLNRQNLLNEGYGSTIRSEVVLTGDLMLDAFRKISPSGKNVTDSKDYIACTIHRADNITSRKNLSEIVSAINQLHQEKEIIIPLHPHTEKQLKTFGLRLECTLLKPIGYPEMKRFIGEAASVITDSGGTCREAFFSSRKSLILMEHPFWPEIIACGGAVNCKPVVNDILANFQRLEDLQPSFESGIFGEGNAAEKISAYLHSLSGKE